MDERTTHAVEAFEALDPIAGDAYAPCTNAAEAWIRASEKKHRAQAMAARAQSLADAAEALERIRWKAWRAARMEYHRKLGNPLPSDLRKEAGQ